MTCRYCKDTGKVLLFSSVVDCDCGNGTRRFVCDFKLHNGNYRKMWVLTYEAKSTSLGFDRARKGVDGDPHHFYWMWYDIDVVLGKLRKLDFDTKPEGIVVTKQQWEVIKKEFDLK